MNIYQKLNAARKKFHTLKLQKTGRNTFAGYSYFELADFLIPALDVMSEVGLCAVVSFDEAVASMTIFDIEKPESNIVISSPMGKAALKGCHEVQNIGAVETYQRRYLWVAALEIVEHDALDASDGPANESDITAVLRGLPNAAFLANDADVNAILRGLSKAASLEVLKSSYQAAMQMLPEANHAAIKKATNARKAELSKVA